MHGAGSVNYSFFNFFAPSHFAGINFFRGFLLFHFFFILSGRQTSHNKPIIHLYVDACDFTFESKTFFSSEKTKDFPKDIWKV